MLTQKEKQELRRQAVNLSALVQIGKTGFSSGTFENIDKDLEAHELVKVTLLKTCELEPREAAIECAAMTDSEIVHMIGRTFVLYRKNEKKGR